MMTTHLFLAALLTVSGSTDASTEVAASQPRRSSSAASPRQVLNSFARCLAQVKNEPARALLALPSVSREQILAAGPLISGNDRCGGNAEVEVEEIGLLGGLAEGLLQSEPQARNLASLSTWSDGAVSRSELRPRNGHEDMGLCIVRRAPREVNALLASVPDSPGEGRAIGALRPYLGPCAPAGSTLSLNRVMIRTQLAIAAYRAAAFLRRNPTLASSAPQRN